ncbi:hypothetical protein J2Z48_002947 [Croceifilum oryzae]|uniref:Uncharacterized protein n=1 Tax=Croceifilum oryzae TaxID=1553429 RepID=A0AAJ1TH30_9BACL|nr:hypothetical protein [Croceifilum oryzae]MDQ0418743.1 hypothetical protein [Croceifilum oryzae]
MNYLAEKETYRILQSDKGNVFVDVRSYGEFHRVAIVFKTLEEAQTHVDDIKDSGFMDEPYEKLVKEFAESEIAQKMYRKAKRDKFKKRFVWYVGSFDEHDKIKYFIQENHAVRPELLAIPEYMELDEANQKEYRYCEFLDDVRKELTK